MPFDPSKSYTLRQEQCKLAVRIKIPQDHHTRWKRIIINPRRTPNRSSCPDNPNYLASTMLKFDWRECKLQNSLKPSKSAKRRKNNLPGYTVYW